MNPLLCIVKVGRQPKPAIYKLYDFAKGSTDVIGQRIGNYTRKPKSRWEKFSAMAYVLDTCRVNASLVAAMSAGKNPRAQDAFQFGWELGKERVLPFVQARTLNNLSSVTQWKVQRVLGKPLTNTPLPANRQPLPSKSKSERRCIDCKKEIFEAGQETRTNRLPPLKNKCQRCGEAVCKKHVW